MSAGYPLVSRLVRVSAGSPARTAESSPLILRPAPPYLHPPRLTLNSRITIRGGCLRLSYATIFVSVVYLVAPLAQLDRASGYEPEGRVFESPRAHHFLSTITPRICVRR